MYVTVVYIEVKPEHVADFLDAIRENHEQSVREPGNLRFDILQSMDDPTHFVTYMAYVDEVAAKAHRETPHYVTFRDTVEPWMVKPRENVRYHGLHPSAPQRP